MEQETMTESNKLSASDLATVIWGMYVLSVSYMVTNIPVCMLTLRSLFAVHLHSTVADPPICWPGSAPSKGRRYDSNHCHAIWLFASLGPRPKTNPSVDRNICTGWGLGTRLHVQAKLTVFGTTVVSFKSAADLAKVATTMARLLVLCCCSLMAAPLTAPLKFASTSS